MSTKHKPLYHVDQDPDGNWKVVDLHGRVIYDAQGSEAPMSEQEARDLAWSWNNGAQNDDEAVQMIIQRDGRLPSWLYDSEASDESR